MKKPRKLSLVNFDPGDIDEKKYKNLSVNKA